jgi:hypothetical protein
MHPDLVQSMVDDRIAELRGRRNQRSAGSSGSVRWLTGGKARVGQLFVWVGTSLIGDGAGHGVQRPQRPSHPSNPSRSEPACSVR